MTRGYGRVRSVAVGVARAVPLAALLVHGLVALAVVAVAPSSGLLGSVVRVTVLDGSVWWSLLVATVALVWAFRPPTDDRVAAWLRRRALPEQLAPMARREMARVRRWRTVPTLAAWLWGWALGTAYNLGIAEHGASSAVAARFRAAADTEGLAGTLLPVVAAYLFGVVGGELTRRLPAGGHEPSARLEVRRPASYLVPWARRLPWLAATCLAVLTVLRAVVGERGETPWSEVTTTSLLVAGGATLALGPLLQRWVVRRPQRLDDEALLAFDDVARSSTAHAVAGATTAALLALSTTVLTDLWNTSLDGPRLHTWLLYPVAVALMAGVVGVWQRYGSAHPGTRPAERGRAT